MPEDTKSKGNESLLEEIRATFKLYNDAWRENRQEGQKDLRCLTLEGPWDPEDKKDRKLNGRPCLSLDELNQYVNQLINDVRLNKRGIKLTPKGEGANDKTAQLHQGIFRDIEYQSNAQIAYTTAFEGAAQRGYGFAQWVTEYESSNSFNQVLRLRPIPNPDSVLYDPDAMLGPLDAEGVFVLDRMSHAKFKRQFKNADKTSFDAEDIRIAPDWVTDKSVVVAMYQKVKKSNRTLLQLDEQTTAYLDEYEGAKLEGDDGAEMLVMKDGQRIPILNSRKCEERQLIQYILNGVEILDTKPLPGKYIRVIPCFGKEMYIDDGTGAKRVTMSLIRMARDPYQLYCYLCSQEAEEAAMTPKTPFVGYTGQFQSDAEAWENLTKTPRAYVQIDPVTDQATGAVLPAPTRPQFVPNFQQYEFAKEAAKRAIQSACGMYNTSVGRHDTNAKSGKAIQELDAQSSQGNFHFIDNFDRFVTYCGMVGEDLLPIYYDSSRTVGSRKPDDSHEMVPINQPVQGPDGAVTGYENDVQQGEHDVTVSTGPSFNSQREAAQDFASQLVKNLGDLPIPPELKARLMALTVKLQNLGPLGDQMAEILSPDQQGEMPPQALQAMGQMKQQLQALNETCKQYEAKIQELTLEKQAKILDNEQKLVIEKMKIEAQVAVAEISTKAQKLEERVAFVQDIAEKLQAQAHEFAMQKDQHAHEQQQADAAAANAAAAQAADHQAAADQQQQAAQQQP